MLGRAAAVSLSTAVSTVARNSIAVSARDLSKMTKARTALDGK